MKKVLIILTMILGGNRIYAQTTDSLCRIPIMVFEDTTFTNIIDTLILFERDYGTEVTDKYTVSASFMGFDELYSCILRLIPDSSFGNTVLSAMVENVKIAYYNTTSVLISSPVPLTTILSFSGAYKMVDCVSYHKGDVLYEDYNGDEKEPNITIVAKLEDGHMQICLISDKEGKVLVGPSCR